MVVPNESVEARTVDGHTAARCLKNKTKNVQIEWIFDWQVGGQPQPQQQQQQPDLSLPLRPNSRTTSAPTSPSKTRESLLQRVSSLTSSVVGRTVQTVQQTQQQFSDAANKINYNKDRCFNLLVIDDQNTDWFDKFLSSSIIKSIQLFNRWNYKLTGRNISVVAKFKAIGTFALNRPNSANYRWQRRRNRAPLSQWPFTAMPPKSSGDFLFLFS